MPLRAHLPHACGVYIMRGADGHVLYVGKAKDLAKRVSQYFNPNKPDLKNQTLAPLIRKIDYLSCASEREALVWERRLIYRHQPFFNALWKDDKSYPYIKLSLQEDFPRLSVVRKKLRDKAAYFGPYPNVSAVRSLLKLLWRRKIFPLRPCEYAFSLQHPLAQKKIRSCLYYHTGECPAPCAGRISPEDYRRIAKDAHCFFSGRFSQLRKRLTGEMAAASSSMDFERAARCRDNARALEHMSEQVRYEEIRPEQVESGLRDSSAVTDLQEALGLKTPPHHIECIDISHLFGRQTVASVVCFMAAEPHTAHYRRMRIQRTAAQNAKDSAPAEESGGNDDFASMAEAVERRLRGLIKEGSPLPDLLLVDGGKGQLSAAENALQALKLHVPLAALAKREEEVFLSGRPEPLILERRRPALRLLQRLRDEAHRFAVKYHRLLRKKALLGDRKGPPAEPPKKKGASP